MGALRLLGDVLALPDRRDVHRAEQCFRKALALAEEIAMRPQAARRLLGLGMLCMRAGHREQARSHLTGAATMFEEMDMRLWPKQAEAEMTAG
jgi:hypothetical protein